MLMTFAHGRLVRDPELRPYGNEGKKLCRITIASNKQNSDGANYLDCTIFGKRGEAVEKYFKQGDAIVVMGNLDQNNYEDKNGNKRTAVEVLVDQASFCGSKAETGTGGYQAPAAAPAPSFATGSDGDFEEISGDDDLPF